MHIAVSYRCHKINIYLKGFLIIDVIDVNYVFGLLHCVCVGSVADILEVHAHTDAAYILWP
jgi:hypothetical protein